jgi:ABC-type uncharacterized transport system permease subunit
MPPPHGATTWRRARFVLAFAGLAVLRSRRCAAAASRCAQRVAGFQAASGDGFAAYSLFTIAALHAGLIALAEKHLHRAVPPALVAGLPPLLTMEKLLFRMIQAGFMLLTLDLLTGRAVFRGDLRQAGHVEPQNRVRHCLLVDLWRPAAGGDAFTAGAAVPPSTGRWPAS